jgi:hypothetical protein
LSSTTNSRTLRRGASATGADASSRFTTTPGSRTANSAPRPGPSLRACTLPPCNAPGFSTTVSPMPSPSAETTEGSCEFGAGGGCGDFVSDIAEGSSLICFGIGTPTAAIASAGLGFAVAGSSNCNASADVSATAETTLYAPEAGKKVFVRARRNVYGFGDPSATTETISLRVGESGQPIAIPIGDAPTEVTLPAGTVTLFLDLHVELSDTAGSCDQYNVDYSFEIVPDAPCKTDARCPAEQKCVRPAGVCTSGGLGEDCADPQDCNTGFCYSGSCSDGSPGSLCTIDRDCQSYCANGHCQAGNENDYCTAVEQCNFEGAHCPQVFIGYGLCTDGGLFDYCVDGADCDEELDCNGGSCGP